MNIRISPNANRWMWSIHKWEPSKCCDIGQEVDVDAGTEDTYDLAADKAKIMYDKLIEKATA